MRSIWFAPPNKSSSPACCCCCCCIFSRLQIIFQAWRWLWGRGPHRVSSFFPLIKINWQQILSHERRMDACCPYARYILICFRLLSVRLPVLPTLIKRGWFVCVFSCVSVCSYLEDIKITPVQNNQLGKTPVPPAVAPFSSTPVIKS